MADLLVSPKTMRVIFVILAASLLVGCHESGTWQDDARNWKRVFRTQKPDGIDRETGALFLSDTQL